MAEAIEEITAPTVSDAYEEDEGNAARGMVMGVLFGSGIWGLMVAAWLVLR